MIAVIDYGMGNFGSILNILRKVGVEAVLTSDPSVLAKADKYILPGVGAFDEGISRINNLQIIPVLEREVLANNKPFLGICLGMQLLASSSEEGALPGLGWIPGKVTRFNFENDQRLRIPHMGWNTLLLKKRSPMFDDMAQDARFYFVHSYYYNCNDDDDILSTSEYGVSFVSAICRGSIIGVQFHPEKSLRWGIQAIRRFIQDV